MSDRGLYFGFRKATCFSLLALALASSTQAQGSFTRYGTACSSPRGIRMFLNGTAPERGRWQSLYINGPSHAIGQLFMGRASVPGGVDLTASGMTGCRQYAASLASVWTLNLGRTGHQRIQNYVPLGTPIGTTVTFQAWCRYVGANPANVLYSEAGRSVVGIEPNLSVADIRRFAPIVRLHPDERYFPMKPMDFIRISRFRHHRSVIRDQGYNKRLRRWVTTNSHHSDYYNVPVSTINSFGTHSNGKNRRPRDGNNGGSLNVFLEPTPDKPRGDSRPNGRVPVFYFYRRVGNLHLVQYWWFFGFNDATPFGFFDHDGDFEHVTLHIRNNQVEKAFYAAHTGGRLYQRNQIRFAGQKPVVYIAKGTHAAYATPGSHHIFGTDKTGDGYWWDTGLMLRPLASQPWKDYAGAWGEVGNNATTTGPLGPWHKRYQR